MSDLDLQHGFHIQEKVENIYLTQEADDRLVYDPRTDAIWSARSGGESDGGTTPDNSNGWVTYTFEGDSQTVIFYNGGTISNVTGPGGGLKEEGIQKYPDSFYHGEGSKFNGWGRLVQHNVSITEYLVYFRIWLYIRICWLNVESRCASYQ